MTGGPPQDGPAKARPRSVLVVDDDRATRYAVGRLLHKAGYAVREAGSAAEALAAALESLPDAVLLDVNLPDLDGFEVCRRLRADARTAASAILHLTAARLRDDDRVRGLQNGADAYLTHPVEPDVLLATVGAVLRARRAEADLAARDAHLRLLVERVPAIIAGLDRDLRFTELLGAGLAPQGLLPGALVGRTALESFGPADPTSPAVAAVRRALAGEAVAWAQEWQGRSYRARVEPRRGPGGEVEGAIVAALDVTEEAAAARALRESEERFRATFEQAPVGIAHVAPDGRWLRVNERLCRLTGYPREELLARTFQDITHEDDLRADLDQVRRLLAGELSSYSLEKRYRTRAGGVVWVDLTVSLVRDAEGRPSYFISVVEDASTRKRAEEAQVQLRHAQKMEAVGRLAGGVAHDFNNVLTAVSGYVELALGRLREGDPVHRDLLEVQKAAQRAAALTRQLLVFSRRERLVQPGLLDPNQVVGDLASFLRRLLGEDLELRLCLDPAAGLVRIDAGHLEQVLMNLTVNARDAMPTGGTLTVTTAAVEVDAARAEALALAPGPHVRLSVADTGCGLSAEVLAHLFEPFFTTKAAGKGTGLGLATVYGLVRQARGAIAAESAAGRGATFHVLLPRAAGEVGPRDAAADDLPRRRGTETVLLVEDEDMVRELAARVLEAHGYDVVAVRGPAEALLECERRMDGIGLLLTDVIMPQMNGRDLAERLRAARPGLKVLFMSGYTAGLLAERGAGTTDVLLEKPFSSAALLRAVRAALDA